MIAVASLSVIVTGTSTFSVLPSPYVTLTTTFVGPPTAVGTSPTTSFLVIDLPVVPSGSVTAAVTSSLFGLCWSSLTTGVTFGVINFASVGVTLIGTFTFSVLPSLYVTLTTATPASFGILPTISFLAIFVPLTAPNTWSFVCFACWSVRVKVFAVGVYFAACVLTLKTIRYGFEALSLLFVESSLRLFSAASMAET